MANPRRAELDVALLPGLVRRRDADEGFATPPLAVVVDVLRMSTTVACALGAGASGVVPCGEIESARRAAGERSGSLQCGERGGVAVEGFDLGNSPHDYTRDRVGGRTLVMSTTNGTGAIDAVKGTHDVVVGAVVNASAVAAYAAAHGGDVVIVCAGTHGRVALEDTVGAGLIAGEILRLSGDRSITDGARLAMGIVDGVRDDASCVSLVSRAEHAATLEGLGFGRDIALACSVDEVPVVPVYDRASGTLVLG